MEHIYRLRPCNDNTIDELSNSYLWFSKPGCFNDVEDANIGLYVENNEIILKALSQVYNEDGIEEIIKKMPHIGICCFTTKQPNNMVRANFPNGKFSICIQFDKNAVEDYFEKSRYAIAPCFKYVTYVKNPIIIVTDGQYHYLAEEDERGYLYKSIKDLLIHPRYIDKFFFYLLTRINNKYKAQEEARIILTGHNIKSFDNSVYGYKIPIPSSCIKSIIIYNDIPNEYVERLKCLTNVKDKLKIL